MTELKPCPFCGSGRQRIVLATDGWAIDCLSCAVQVGFDSAEEDAVLAWNTRAESTTHIREALEEIIARAPDRAEAMFEALGSIVEGL